MPPHPFPAAVAPLVSGDNLSTMSAPSSAVPAAVTMGASLGGSALLLVVVGCLFWSKRKKTSDAGSIADRGMPATAPVQPPPMQQESMPMVPPPALVAVPAPAPVAAPVQPDAKPVVPESVVPQAQQLEQQPQPDAKAPDAAAPAALDAPHTDDAASDNSNEAADEPKDLPGGPHAHSVRSRGSITSTAAFSHRLIMAAPFGGAANGSDEPTFLFIPQPTDDDLDDTPPAPPAGASASPLAVTGMAAAAAAAKSAASPASEPAPLLPSQQPLFRATPSLPTRLFEEEEVGPTSPMPLTASTLAALRAHASVARHAAENIPATGSRALAMSLIAPSKTEGSPRKTVRGTVPIVEETKEETAATTLAADETTDNTPPTPGPETVLMRILATAEADQAQSLVHKRPSMPNPMADQQRRLAREAEEAMRRRNAAAEPQTPGSPDTIAISVTDSDASSSDDSDRPLGVIVPGAVAASQATVATASPVISARRAAGVALPPSPAVTPAAVAPATVTAAAAE
ncbi:hypothetical protein AMAG_14678 [Allomyces macrogynus ATCC 38327]|uniref:Uncharacterized protein n=1 Tax=Allomyces macrogynus (strain ATCC 38327) TaxID=578462 RepID=A0A0L0T792_ALLM3|nr:hypothetical protein AMAG_14678 [Allomyces macrogynus ATCC 38327]|eukprot:KNE70556.1 hypothetical protein AMAG_14678 [Allomyces macrogynus ATCC 38327]